MKKRTPLSVLAATLAMGLAACSSTPKQWYLNGNSPEQFRADEQRCSQSAAAVAGAGMDGAAQISQQSNAYNYKAAGGASLLALMFTAGLAQDEMVSCLKKAGYTPAR